MESPRIVCYHYSSKTLPCLCIFPGEDFIFSQIEEKLNIPTVYDGDLYLFHTQPVGSWTHRHAELEMNLVVRGSATYLLNQEHRTLKTGTILWLFPKHDHVLLKQSSDFTMWIMYVRPSVLQRLCTHETSVVLQETNPAGQFQKHLPPLHLSRLNTLFEGVTSKKLESELFNSGLGYALLLSWDAYLSSDSVSLGRRVHPAVQKTVIMLREETEATSLKQLGHQFGLSASHLSGLFKEQTGISFVDFRNRQRLERFLRTYDQGHVTMSAAALDAGFGSYPQFYRIFLQLMGVTPTEYYRARSCDVRLIR